MDSGEFRFSRNPLVFWYVSLPAYLWQIIKGESNRLYHMFSIPELARTLFAPWKKDEISMEGLALSDRFQVWVGNLASRFVALIIRSFVIMIGLGALSIYFTVGVIIIGGLCALPVIIFAVLVYGGINGVI